TAASSSPTASPTLMLSSPSSRACSPRACPRRPTSSRPTPSRPRAPTPAPRRPPRGRPPPPNLESAAAQQAAVAKAAAEPAIIGVIAGRVIVGANPHEVQTLASGAVRWKGAVGALPYVVARGLDGATTVSATAFAAEAAGIGVMATGGIGGIHFRGRDGSADVPPLCPSRGPGVC